MENFDYRGVDRTEELTALAKVLAQNPGGLTVESLRKILGYGKNRMGFIMPLSIQVGVAQKVNNIRAVMFYTPKDAVAARADQNEVCSKLHKLRVSKQRLARQLKAAGCKAAKKEDNFVRNFTSAADGVFRKFGINSIFDTSHLLEHANGD